VVWTVLASAAAAIYLATVLQQHCKHASASRSSESLQTTSISFRNVTVSAAEVQLQSQCMLLHIPTPAAAAAVMLLLSISVRNLPNSCCYSPFKLNPQDANHLLATPPQSTLVNY
jgi:hypothetical protein